MRIDKAKLVKNFNAKIRRLQNKGISSENLPRRIKQSDLSSKSAVEAAISFTNRGNQRYQVHTVFSDGSYLSKKEFSEIKRLQSRANRNRTKRIKRFDNKPFVVGSEALYGIDGTSRSVKEDRFRDRSPKFSKKSFSSRREYELYKSKLEKLASPDYITYRDEMLRENLLKGLRSTTNNQTLIDGVAALDLDELIEKYYTSDFKISYRYTEEDMQRADLITAAVFGIEMG